VSPGSKLGHRCRCRAGHPGATCAVNKIIQSRLLAAAFLAAIIDNLSTPVLATTTLTRDRGISFILRWSTWRRRHQARAELSHYQRRGELRHHPSHRLINKQAPQDQFKVLL
jgi:hypothetical protein